MHAEVARRLAADEGNLREVAGKDAATHGETAQQLFAELGAHAELAALEPSAPAAQARASA